MRADEGVVAVDGRVAEPDPGDVEHGVGGTGGQGPDLDPQVTCARHALILPELRGLRVGC